MTPTAPAPSSMTYNGCLLIHVATRSLMSSTALLAPAELFYFFFHPSGPRPLLVFTDNPFISTLFERTSIWPAVMSKLDF